jgi:ribonuclease III
MAAKHSFQADVHEHRMTRRSKPAPDLGVLEEAIGYCFANRDGLVQAVTHISAVHDETRRDASYQRLEFLGDRVLGLCIADLLFRTFPQAEEGELSRRLSERVRKETCLSIALGWNLGAYLQLGPGESQSGGRRNKAILADSCEAVIGAVFIDGGYLAARTVIERAFGDALHAPNAPIRDAKTALQEWAQGDRRPAPTYAILDRTGPDHAPRFRITVNVEGLDSAIGHGTSRRQAEQDAARTMLIREKIWQDKSVSEDDPVEENEDIAMNDNTHE